MTSADDLVDEQIRYYRERAPEYDRWWNREGRYDLGPEFAERWDRETAALRAALDAFGPAGDVLEIAAGTGNWTREVLRHADRVTALDSSPETLEVSREKLGGDADRVDFVAADLFDWGPPRRFDAVVSTFWISHVPPARWTDFWSLVGDCLRPGGRAWFADNAHPDLAAAAGHPTKRVEGRTITGIEGPTDLDTHVADRSLSDGRRFTIVKRFWTPDELTADLADLGWQAEVTTTDWAFLHGSAQPT